MIIKKAAGLVLTEEEGHHFVHFEDDPSISASIDAAYFEDELDIYPLTTRQIQQVALWYTELRT